MGLRWLVAAGPELEGTPGMPQAPGRGGEARSFPSSASHNEGIEGIQLDVTSAGMLLACFLMHGGMKLKKYSPKMRYRLACRSSMKK